MEARITAAHLQVMKEVYAFVLYPCIRKFMSIVFYVVDAGQ